MLKFLLPLLFLATSAFAQMYDLTSMPKGYSFVSIGTDARSTLRFVRRDGDEYVFEEANEYFDGRRDTTLIRVNNASQTTFWADADAQTFFSPHDCGPSLGECFYTMTDESGATKVKTVSRMIGDVRFSEEYTWNGEEWRFWDRDCTIYDEYGFWIDYVRTYWDAETTQGYREQNAPNRIDELWRICDPAAAVS